MQTLTPTAFDAAAAHYDADFTDSTLGRWLRRRVWAVYQQYFAAGHHLLELTCGTGADAIWLAQQGLTITATDGSPEMVSIARHKVQQAQVTDQVTVQPLSLQALIAENAFSGMPLFDGVYSNFGGLNTIPTWRLLAQTLARYIRPGGTAVFVPMGPFCPWETAWYGAHGQVRQAVRRWQQPAAAVIGDTTIPIWYPSARRLRRDFAPWFETVHSHSLGLWLPPSYLDHWVAKWPTVFQALNRLEKATGRLTADWGDHYIIIFRRNSSTVSL